MRIEIPHSAHPVTRVNVLTPSGPICADFTPEHKFFDVELPEGISQDEVGIFVQYLNNGNQPVDYVVLKEPKPADPPADEAVTDEQIDEAIEFGVMTEAFVTGTSDEVEHSLLPTNESCGCEKPAEACSNCDPEDAIATQE